MPTLLPERLKQRAECQDLEKEGHEIDLFPFVLETQASVFECFERVCQQSEFMTGNKQSLQESHIIMP